MIGLVLMTATLLQGCGAPKELADLVIIGPKVFTADAAAPWAEAIAVRGERIVRVGSEEDVSELIGPQTSVGRQSGGLIVPGFNDAHVHMVEGGESLIGIRLRDAATAEEFRDTIRDHVRELPEGTWVLQGNWDHEAWPTKQHPTRHLIDPVTTHHPVFVTRLDGHISLANSLALELAGITSTTPDPLGGTIVRDPGSGEPTGILIDAARELIHAVIPEPTDEEIRKRLEAALWHAASLGITSVQDNTNAQIYRVYGQLREEVRLLVRVNAWYPIELREQLAREGVTGPSGDLLLRRGTVKMFADGSMGAGSALFYDVYTDDHETSGLAMWTVEELNRQIQEADAMGFNIACHAIGDRANTEVLDAFERAFGVNTSRKSPRRHRLEHAQVVRKEDMPRFAELGIIASIQPSHAIDDMRWAEKRIGLERSADSYQVGGFLAAGAHVAFGTDWFVEPLDPRLTLYAAVTREFPQGGPEGGWFPGQKISLREAITAYTLGSAYVEGMEAEKGKLAPGYLADFTMFERDLFELDPRDWLETPVVLTVMGGNITFGVK
jgi:predicted amidohydrolase YtcJ